MAFLGTLLPDACANINCLMKEEFLKRLAATKNQEEWDAIAEEVKQANGGAFPREWWWHEIHVLNLYENTKDGWKVET